MNSRSSLLAAAVLLCASGCALPTEGEAAPNPARSSPAAVKDASGAVDANATAGTAIASDEALPSSVNESAKKDNTAPADDNARPNLKTRTLGGRLYWT